MEHRDPTAADDAVSVYREYAPRPELREHVRAFAWWGPAGQQPVPGRPVREFYVGRNDALMPMFADAHTSILFDLGLAYAGEGRWTTCPTAGNATVTGAVTRATYVSAGNRPAMIGVYLRTRGAAELLGVPADALVDRIVPLHDLWNATLDSDEPSLASVEELLMRRLARVSSGERGTRIAAVASYVRERGGRVTTASLSDLTGYSRQHVTRLFNEYVGVGPKLYARLARFRAGLATFRRGESMVWSRLAAELGFADQSHLIADFREFSGFTPEQLIRGDTFHPFIGDHSS